MEVSTWLVSPPDFSRCCLANCSKASPQVQKFRSGRLRMRHLSLWPMCVHVGGKPQRLCPAPPVLHHGAGLEVQVVAGLQRIRLCARLRQRRHQSAGGLSGRTGGSKTAQAFDEAVLSSVALASATRFSFGRPSSPFLRAVMRYWAGQWGLIVIRVVGHRRHTLGLLLLGLCSRFVRPCCLTAWLYLTFKGWLVPFTRALPHRRLAPSSASTCAPRQHYSRKGRPVTRAITAGQPSRTLSPCAFGGHHCCRNASAGCMSSSRIRDAACLFNSISSSTRAVECRRAMTAVCPPATAAARCAKSKRAGSASPTSSASSSAATGSAWRARLVGLLSPQPLALLGGTLG